MDKLVVSYATAILELQNEENISNLDTLKELEMIYSSFDDEIKKFLYSKAVNSLDKKQVLEKALKGFNQNVTNFIYVLIDNYRIDLLKDIIDTYKDLIDKEEGIIKVNVRLSKPLNDVQKNDLKAIIKNKFFNDEKYNDIVINEIIDSTILKGLVIECRGHILDASLLNKQESLKEYLEK